MFNGYGGFLFPVDPWQRHKRKKDARWKNNREFMNWFIYLTNLYLNTFEWEGLPDTCNARYLEETLYWDAKALFFDDKNMGYMALACAGEGQMNVYWEYTRYMAVSNMYNEVYDADDCVLIRANQTVYPPLFMIETLAAKIADSGRTIDVYAKTMKKPWLITCENDDKLTHKTLIEEVDDNELMVVGANRLGGESMRAYGNGQDGQGLLALWRHKHNLLDETLTYMGINNANTEKRERLISNEVEANNQLIMLNVDSALDWRKKACEEINKKFGLNISVKLKHDYLTELGKDGDDGNGEKNNRAKEDN